MLEFEDFAGERLSQGEDGASAEVGELDAFAHVLAHLVGFVDGAGIAEGNLAVFVIHLVVVHHGAVAVDFAVALVGVDDDIEVLVRTEDFGNDAAEALFEHADERSAVNVLGFLEVVECFNQTCGFTFLLGHYFCKYACLLSWDGCVVCVVAGLT